VGEAVKAILGLAVFLLFTGGILGFTVGLSSFGRWRGWSDYFAPETERPPHSQWPWLCRLHLYHRWHSYRSEQGRYQRCSGCGLTRDIPAIRPI
jgi:hypothetical protein